MGEQGLDTGHIDGVEMLSSEPDWDENDHGAPVACLEALHIVLPQGRNAIGRDPVSATGRI